MGAKYEEYLHIRQVQYGQLEVTATKAANSTAASRTHACCAPSYHEGDERVAEPLVSKLLCKDFSTKRAMTVQCIGLIDTLCRSTVCCLARTSNLHLIIMACTRSLCFDNVGMYSSYL
jgi:hypothetical protein